MVKEKPEIADESGDKYKYGFVTDIAADTAPKGLNEDIIRLISRKKGEPEWLLEWRLKAFEFCYDLSVGFVHRSAGLYCLSALCLEQNPAQPQGNDC